MVSALEWVLVGVVVYALVVMLLRARGYLPDYVKGGGPIVTLHTQRGKEILEWLSKPRRLWRAWTNLGLGIGLVIMVGTGVLVLISAYQSIVNPTPTALTEPRNALVIPGVNQFLPPSVAPEIVTGLVIALIVHEGGHGLLCRVGDIDIESMGLVFLSFIPMGAFVAPDEESVARAKRGDQARMFVAGVTNNFAIGFLALLVLFGPVMASFSVVGGVPIGNSLPGGPADQAGIDSGDVITAVDGQPVANVTELRDALDAAGPTVAVDRRDADPVTVERNVYVRSAATDAPVAENDTIMAVNDTAVGTASEFYDAVRNRTVVRLSRANASDVTTAIGGYVRVLENGSLAAAGAPPGSVAIVTHVGDRRVETAGELEDVIGNAAAGDRLQLVAYVDGERETYDVTLGDSRSVRERLGGIVSTGISGILVGDFGVDPYPAGAFLEILGGESEQPTGLVELGFIQQLSLFLFLPFVAIVGLFNYGFPGFTGIATNFYTVDGVLGVLGTGGGFLVANLLFWTAWINIVVGQFNLFPTYPLDGGHLVRAITETVVARLPIEDGRRVTTAVTLGISLIVLGSMAMLFIGPNLLA